MCDRYGLVPVPDELKQLSLGGIELVDANDPGNANEWTIESDTTPGAGQHDYVISQKRKSFTLYEVDRVADDVTVLKEQVRQLQLELASMRVSIAESSAGAFKPTVALIMSAIAAIFLVN